ncbi:FtsK/SpoIIIE domain-containing protein [Peribacillus simplex]|uniref:Cell division protein FtsK/SpoIIIE n=1 Tax=Peribacillus simplex TaxID=1478 RepID=A0AAN2PG21_9BACI|nr:FtsK/SpoIIIE domain-containing protein [Peribacillus simplex]CEG31469.1 cell division protein FtsK/SpoIIIE [Peribacillus simplex]
MFVEIASGITFASIYGIAKFSSEGNSGNDSKKILKIADAVGLKKDGKSIRIFRKYRPKEKKYTEYVYQIPLGLSEKDFLDKLDKFEDGLNNKKTMYKYKLSKLKHLKLKDIREAEDTFEFIKDSIREVIKIRKSIELSYDGMLHFKVYDTGIPDKIKFDEKLWDKCQGWEMPVGETREGVLFHKLDDGHTVIAGATTFGKSAFLKLLVSTLLKNKPDKTELSLIDLKGGLEMMYFEHCKQTVNFADNLEKASDVLKSIREDIEKRQRRLRIKGVNNIKKAGIKKRHFVIVDEASQLAPSMNVGKGEKALALQCQADMAFITRIGHSMGYTLIYATQYPVGDIMPNQIKANSNTTMCFRLETDTQSMTVLDRNGAEDIELRGRMIYSVPSGYQQVQSYLIADKTINEVVAPNIVIRPRKDDISEVLLEKGAKDRQYTIEFKETDIP